MTQQNKSALSREAWRQNNIAESNFRHTQVEIVGQMAYKIVAEREDLTVSMEQNSVLFTLAKARVWASEGWSIVVTDSDGQVLYPTVLAHAIDLMISAGELREADRARCVHRPLARAAVGTHKRALAELS